MTELTNDALGAPVVTELWGIHRRHGKVEALQVVDLQLHAGEPVALLGPNRAGKTTAVGILPGQRRPDAGSVRRSGPGPDPALPAARRLVGVTPEEIGLPNSRTVWEAVDPVRVHSPDSASTRALLGCFGFWELTADDRPRV